MKPFLSIFIASGLLLSANLASANDSKYEKSDLIDCSTATTSFELKEALSDDSRLYFEINSDQIFTRKNSEIVFKLPKTYTDKTNFKVEISENKRESKIREDVSSVWNIINDKSLQARAPTEEKYCIKYTQKYTRSTYTVAVSNDKKHFENSLISGPEERWSLSIDVPFNKVDQLKYDSTTSQVIEKEVPSNVYLGINYHLGDVFINQTSSHWALKFMMPIQKDPSEALGLGISYDFDWATIFVAQVYVRDDVSDVNGEIGGTDSTIVGLSFDIGHGASWFK